MKATIKKVPDGKYVADIVAIESGFDDEGKKLVEWFLAFVEGPYKGEILRKPFYLVKQSVVDILKDELAILGIEAKNEQEFLAKKDQAVGMRIRFSAVTRDDGRPAYYLNSVIRTGDGVPASAVHVDW